MLLEHMFFLKDRTSILHALATVDEPPAGVARILITHSHYDHLGGAAELAAPVYVASAEAAWMTAQAAHPTITSPSLGSIQAVVADTLL
jgi:N-acyl homoserine lactone hydrolase